MLEVEKETRDFLTINKKDYNEKKIVKTQKFIAPTNYESPYNIINGPYRQYLKYFKYDKNIPIESDIEDISDYLKNKKFHWKKLLPKDTPNQYIIEWEKKKSLKSIYQLDYFKNLEYDLLSYDNQADKNTPHIYLSDDWIIPETIYSKSYRDIKRLKVYGNEITLKRNSIKPQQNLRVNSKQKKFFKVKTGNSEYASIIGAIGNKILMKNTEVDIVNK